MADGIEQTLGLTPLNDIIEKEKNNTPITNNNVPKTSNIVDNKSNFLGINSSKHDLEIDDIRNKAIDAFDTLMNVGQNVDPIRSARLFEVAGQFLKTAQDSANDRLKREIDLAKLKMTARKLESAEGITGLMETGMEVLASRNDLIKQMLDQNKGPVVDGIIKDNNNS